MRESEIQAGTFEHARSLGWLAMKFESPGRRNVPDGIFIPPTIPIFFIEFKATGKTPSKGQWREIERIRERGHAVYVIDDIEAGKSLINAINLLR